MELSPGTRLGTYEIVAPIGAGGMGEVYRAHDTKLGRDVAIKILPEAFARDAARLSRFQREAKMLASLNHPNIATIYGLEDSNGVHYLVMELVPGETLADRIRRDGAVPIVETLNIANQIAEALEAAHEKGIIHRDLKPANVKVTPEGKVKVLDFGLAKAYAEDTGSHDPNSSPTLTAAATMQGMIMGTAAYMSPEQARGKAVDRRTDIWAFGCVLYELASGDQLFGGESVTDTLAQVITKEPDWGRVPARIQPLLRWCLERDTKKRLRDVADGMASLEEMPEQKYEPPSAISAPKWLWGIAVAACLVALALAAMRFLQKPPSAPESVRYQIRLPDNVYFSQTASFALSPDGHHIAFSALGLNSPPAVWIQDLDGSEARALPDTRTGPTVPPFFWSPDSRYIAFSGGGSMLRKADIQTGTSQDICEKPNPPIGGSWNADGVIIFGSTFTGLWRVSASGGTPVHLTVLDANRQEREHELPAFLPDGRHFLYLRISKIPADTGIYVGSLDDPPERQNETLLLQTGFGAAFVPTPGSMVGHLLFLRGGALMTQSFDPDNLKLIGDPTPVVDQVSSTYETGYFSASPTTLVYRTLNSNAYTQLTWFDSQGKSTGTVGDPGYVGDQVISPDGTRIAYRRDSEDHSDKDLWLLDIARGTSTRFTFGGSWNDAPVWSPDGTQIVFTSNRSGNFDLYRRPANGATNEELLFHTDENKIPWSWSPNGRYLIYGVTLNITGGREDLWVLPMLGDRTPFPFSRTPFDQSEPQFSPDGRWVAYTSNESGQHEVYVRAFTAPPAPTDTGEKWIISNGGGWAPIWRADGKAIAYVGAGRDSWMTVSVATTPSFHAGVPQLLFPFPPGTYTQTAGADLKRFLIAVPASQKGPQTFSVLVNWAPATKN
jgi:serine/threonine protein kinase/Tol biopolymer transport system component